MTVKLVGGPNRRGCTILSSVLNSRSRLKSVSFGAANAHSNLATARVSVGYSKLSCRVLRGTLTRTGTKQRRVLKYVASAVTRPHPSLGPRIPQVRRVVVPHRFVNTIVNPNKGVVRRVRRSANTAVAVSRRSNINGIRISTPSGTSVSTTVTGVGTVTTIPRIKRICSNAVGDVVPCNYFIRVLPNGRKLLRVSRVT